jgi:histidyl-tRNA synthetase
MPDLVESKPLSGFQDLLPQDALAFEGAVERLKQVFRRYGYAPIDAPCIYRFETLTGGRAGIDKELFEWHKKEGRDKTEQGDHIALRFDLTVPLARYVAANAASLTFPFKRYDVGKVWRGERPAKGRYREFYQCDFDVVGTVAPSSDLEVALVMADAVTACGVDKFRVRLNDRQILNGLLASLGLLERSSDILRVVDKLDKIGPEAVTEELTRPAEGDKPGLGISPVAATSVLSFTRLSSELAGDALLAELARRFESNPVAKAGVERLRFVVKGAQDLRGADRFAVDLSIARGLGYYTGTVYETVLLDAPEFGSVCSGGRYDDLASYYTKQWLPGVGASVGLSRLLTALAKISSDSSKKAAPCPVLVAVAPEVDPIEGTRTADLLRKAGIGAEVYHAQAIKDQPSTAAKLGKQLKYGDARGHRLVVIVAPDELSRRAVVVKDMASQKQDEVPLSGLVDAAMRHVSS